MLMRTLFTLVRVEVSGTLNDTLKRAQRAGSVG